MITVKEDDIISDMKFVTAINCMDGRVQLPVFFWLKKRYFADYVDMITAPGPIRILSENNDNTELLALKNRVEISIQKHNSTLIALVGHHDCAGNPVDKETQLQQIDKGMTTIKSWGYTASILGLWVDEYWQVHPVSESSPSK